MELALVSLILIPLAFGLVDYGLLWQKRQLVEEAARAGARQGATTCLVTPGSSCDKGNREWDDYYVLRAVHAALGTSASDVERVIVYRIPRLGYVDTLADGTTAPITDGRPVSRCDERTTTGGVDGYCNVYGPELLADLGSMTVDEAKSVFTCAPESGPSRYYCPTKGLRARNSYGNTSIGVSVRLRHPHVTGLFGDEVDVESRAVFLIEPNPSAPKAAIIVVSPPPPPDVTVPPSTTTTTTTTSTTPPTTTTTSVVPDPGGGTTTASPTSAEPTSTTTTRARVGGGTT